MVSPNTYSEEDLAYVEGVFPELAQIGSSELRRKVAEIWIDVWHESNWARIEDSPKNPKNVSKPLSTHIRSVTQQALATAEIMKSLHGLEYDRDTIIAGGLLHDVSKLVEYEPSTAGSGISSERGRLIQHAVYGAHKAWEKGLPDSIVHIIVSHTKNSNREPATWECVVIRYVDYLDSDALLWQEGKPLLLG